MGDRLGRWFVTPDRTGRTPSQTVTTALPAIFTNPLDVNAWAQLGIVLAGAAGVVVGGKKVLRKKRVPSITKQ